MQKQTSLYIPAPCHEDWNKMIPTQQGKFCGSCNKQVVDFSLMSDNQVLNFLSQQPGKLCGRFDAKQLQRPLIETKIKKKKSWWMAAFMPLLLLNKNHYSAKSILLKSDTSINLSEPDNATMGIILEDLVSQVTIKGKIVNENDQPIAYATVMQKGTRNETVSDSIGNFSIGINSNDSMIAIVASSAGYETIEKQVKLINTTAVTITMKMNKYELNGEVVIVAGGISSYTSIKPIDTIATAVRKILNISTFKIYPNPALKGSTIHLEIKQAGEYQLQLLDNQSRLMKAEEINTDSEKSTALITIPSNIATGVYYLRLISQQTKKSYTEKIIIQ